MGKDKTGSPLKDLKERVDRAGLSRREALATVFGAAGAAGAVLFAIDTGKGHTDYTNCAPDSCASACKTCRDGCSNGPDK